MLGQDKSAELLSKLYFSSRTLVASKADRFVVFSDLHLGNGSSIDDFSTNSEMFLIVLESYWLNGYILILNGDIEELLRFSLEKIQNSWPAVYDLFGKFKQAGRLVKLVGNHDIDLLFDSAPSSMPIEEGLRLIVNGHTLFIFHGHQVGEHSKRTGLLMKFVLRYLANPLRIKNYSLRNDSGRRFKIERMIYQFSARKKIVSLIGHTHRPLFESMSKFDSLRFEIENLCNKYRKAGPRKRERIRATIGNLRRELATLLERDTKSDYRSSLYNESLVVPCLFNSGTVVGKRGMTCLEIINGDITLLHWFRDGQSLRHRGNPHGGIEELPGTPYYRRVIKRDTIDNIFMRIDLLGG